MAARARKEPTRTATRPRLSGDRTDSPPPTSRASDNAPLWLDAVRRVERLVGVPVERLVTSDAYFDALPKLRRAQAQMADYVAGVTILNDLTDRDAQKREVASGSRFWTGKNIPGFGPLGPEIITLDEIRDPYDLWMTCAVNGEERMRVNTRDQIWKLPVILEHFSRYIPIEPGDMFSTGAPGGVAVGKPNAAELFLKPGDIVECSIEGIATLRTYIVNA